MTNAISLDISLISDVNSVIYKLIPRANRHLEKNNSQWQIMIMRDAHLVRGESRFHLNNSVNESLQFIQLDIF